MQLDNPTPSMVKFATTVDYPDDQRWFTRARIIQPPQQLFDELRVCWQLIVAARKQSAIILDSSSGRLHPEIIASVMIGLLPKRHRPPIVMAGCMWKQDTGLLGWLQKRMIKFADRAITLYAVQSSEELRLFPHIWGLAANKVRFSPYFATIAERDLQFVSQTEPYIFAGGNAHRDYESLLMAARELPTYRFIIATKLLEGRTDVPANVSAGAVSHQEFMRLLQGATVVVVPLCKNMNRAAGQQTYLNAMWLGKTTIVTDSLGVHDHVRHAETGFIVDGTPASLIQTLCWVLDSVNADAITRLNDAARAAVQENFTFGHHVTRLLAILEEAIAIQRR